MGENNSGKEYFETISTLGKNLFRDFLSDLTRKRQSSLLLSSIITLLLSFTIIIPIDSTISGVKFSFTNPQILPILAGFISLYFLLLYIASVMQDLQYAKYIEMPLQAEILTIADKVSGNLAHNLFDTIKSISDITVQFSETSKNIRETKKKVVDWKRKTISIYSEMKNQGKSEQEIERFLEQNKQEFEAMQSQFQEKDNRLRDNSEITKGTIQNQFNEQGTLINKLEILTTFYSRYRVWRNVVIILEIVFPVILGIAAVFSVLWLHLL